MHYDIIVIGSGPAGLSAALTARARNKTVLVVGNRWQDSPLARAERVDNYLGLPNQSGADLLETFHAHAKEAGVALLEGRALSALPWNGFQVSVGSQVLSAGALILAPGVVRQKKFPGEAEYLGRGVSYCATCDAHFYHGKTVAVLGYSSQSCREADFLAETCEKVLYFPAVPHEVQVGEGVEVIREKPTAILGDRQARILETNSQKQYAVDGIFVLRAAVAPEKLVPGIAVEENHVRVDLQMRTNLPGCFACGDVTGPPYQYIKAAGQGNVAALSATAYLAEQKKKE